ncbi:hypothetical protein HHE014_00600 [Helicobacter heilmannii]|nr:hypothetical protein HHE014_00600 [Helicobacter heilmannii]
MCCELLRVVLSIEFVSSKSAESAVFTGLLEKWHTLRKGFKVGFSKLD